MSNSQVQSSLQLYLQQINETPLLSAAEERRLAECIQATGCPDSRDRMIRSNLRLVVAIAKRYARCGMALGDLIEEGNLGLMRAVESYDPNHGARFSTYASWWIKQAIRRSMLNAVQPVRVPAYMVELVTRWKRTVQELEDRLGRPPSLSEMTQAMQLPPRKLRAVRSAVRAAQRPSTPVNDDPERFPTFTETLTDERTPPPEAAAALRDDVEALRRLLCTIDDREAKILRLRYGLDGSTPLTLKEIGGHIGLTRERVRQLEIQALRRLHSLLEGSPIKRLARRPLRASA